MSGCSEIYKMQNLPHEISEECRYYFLSHIKENEVLLPGSSLHSSVVCQSVLFKFNYYSGYFLILPFWVFLYHKSVFMCVTFEIQMCFDFQ